ncbi:MAG: Ig-like domain-containing protein, partial [Chloroflexota bacterium]
MLKGVHHLILLALLLVLLAACGAEAEPTPTLTPTPLPTDTPLPTPTEVSPPEVIIEDPLSNATAVVGEQVLIQSTATDEIGISRVELQVDGALVRSDNTPEETPLTRYSLLQAWEPTAVGEHTIRVTAFRADGTPSEPASIIIIAEEGDPAAVEAGPQPCSATASTNLNVRQGPG